jgi:hypothetical protein
MTATHIDLSDNSGIPVDHDDDMPFSREAELRFNSLWADIQSAFVDDPRAAVAGADELVTEVMDRMGDWFAERRSTLGRTCAGDSPVDTEELRLTLHRYRELFHRLLSL